MLGVPHAAHARAGRQELDARAGEYARPAAAHHRSAAFLGSGLDACCRAIPASIVVNHREIPAGLLVDEVLGFRRFADAEFSRRCAADHRARCERYIAGSFRRGNEQWPVLGLRTLLEDPAFAGQRAHERQCNAERRAAPQLLVAS